MAVRLRFLGVVLPTTVPADGLISCSLTATNESGSVVSLCETLHLALSVADAASGLPLPAGAPLSLREARASIGLDGHGTLRCRLQSSAGAWRRPVRIMLSSAAPAAVQRRGVQTPAHVPVVPAFTHALMLAAGSALAPGDALPALLSAGGMLLEEPTRITAGFGSISWDAALLLDELFSAIGGEASPRALRPPPKSAAVQRLPPPASAAARIAAALAGLRWRGARVCDLGSGTGAVGLSAARRGARVLLTDLPEMLPLARLNAAAAAAAIRAASGEVAVAPLVWREDDAPACAHGDAAADAPLLARCCGGVVGPFDVVIASECAFRAELFSALVATVRRLQPRLLLVSARDRGCCDISDYIALLSEHFEVAELTPAPAAAATAPPPPPPLHSADSGLAALVADGRLAVLPLLPPRAAAVADAACVLSKRGQPPRIFAMLPRVAERASG